MYVEASFSDVDSRNHNKEQNCVQFEPLQEYTPS